MRKLLIIMSLVLFGLSCGYSLRGTGSSLPPHIRTINVPMFENNTTRFQLDLKLTESVRDELTARGEVEVSPERTGADAVLIGEITAFTVNPIGFGQDATASSYNIVVVAKIVLRDLVNNRVLFSNPHFSYQQSYDVPDGTDFESVQQAAIDAIAVKFARTLVMNLLEGF
jgi:hypothetical protein